MGVIEVEEVFKGFVGGEREKVGRIGGLDMEAWLRGGCAKVQMGEDDG